MADERVAYSDDEANATWTVVGLILGALVVAVALYFGGVFDHESGPSLLFSGPRIEQPRPQAGH